MSISEYERKKLLEKAAKLKAEKEGTGQQAEALSKQHEQDQQIDQRIEQTRAAVKATAQATGKFAKDLAAKTAKLAQDQAQRTKAKADAWKQEKEVKRAEAAKKKNPLSTGEPTTRTDDAMDHAGIGQGRKRVLLALIGSVVLVGTGTLALGYMTRTKEAAPPLAEPAVQSNQVETTRPQQPGPDIAPVMASAPPQKQEQIYKEEESSVVAEEPKEAMPIQKDEKTQMEIEASKPAFKKDPMTKTSKTTRHLEVAKPVKEDWQDKASSDLDKFAEQLR
ncbi:hypothetical protein [Xanthomonas axonopodis]